MKKIKEYDDMPYLETEEEAAENIADINKRRDVKKEIIKLEFLLRQIVLKKIKQIKQKK